MCASQQNRKKTLKPLFWEFKVTDNDTIEKLDASACYNKHHVCAYLQAFYAARVNSIKITTFGGVHFFDVRVRRPP